MLLKAKNLGKAVIGQLGDYPVLPLPTPADDDRTSLESLNLQEQALQLKVEARISETRGIKGNIMYCLYSPPWAED